MMSNIGYVFVNPLLILITTANVLLSEPCQRNQQRETAFDICKEQFANFTFSWLNIIHSLPTSGDISYSCSCEIHVEMTSRLTFILDSGDTSLGNASLCIWNISGHDDSQNRSLTKLFSCAGNGTEAGQLYFENPISIKIFLNVSGHPNKSHYLNVCIFGLLSFTLKCDGKVNISDQQDDIIIGSNINGETSAEANTGLIGGVIGTFVVTLVVGLMVFIKIYWKKRIGQSSYEGRGIPQEERHYESIRPGSCEVRGIPHEERHYESIRPGSYEVLGIPREEHHYESITGNNLENPYDVIEWANGNEEPSRDNSINRVEESTYNNVSTQLTNVDQAYNTYVNELFVPETPHAEHL